VTRIQKFFFHLCMVLSVAAMIYGHALIITSGRWFIPGKEKYNIDTRWVSDFVAVYPEGLWLKASILIFCVAIIIRVRSRLSRLGGGSRETLAWFWEMTISIGLISGLLLVVLYDTPPPKYTVVQSQTWWQEWFGGVSRKTVSAPPDWDRVGHHRVGFRIFICSFIAMVTTSVISEFMRRNLRQFRVNLVVLLLILGCTFWLILFTNSLAGIPQRALLILIFYWVWRAAFVESTGKSIKELETDSTRIIT
jgi:hypothetical protein